MPTGRTSYLTHYGEFMISLNLHKPSLLPLHQKEKAQCLPVSLHTVHKVFSSGSNFFFFKKKGPRKKV